MISEILVYKYWIWIITNVISTVTLKLVKQSPFKIQYIVEV